MVMRLLLAIFGLFSLAAASASAQCTISLNPTSVTLTSASSGTSSSVSITTASTCTRTVTSNNPDWIIVTFGQTGTGNGTFGFTYGTNLSPSVRTGTITVTSVPTGGTGGSTTTFTVRQPGANCTYSFSPTGINAVAKNVVPVSLSVSTSCIWTASTSTSWITLSNGGPFTGNGGITVSIADNPNAASRVGSIQINDQNINVQQLGISCSYAVTPAGPINIPAAGTTLAFAVNTDPACSWTTVNSASWITIPSGVQAGPQNVSVTVAPNLVPQSRTSILTIAGQQITISQAGVGINFTAASIQNASSFASGPLSPGEIFVLYGTGLGPANLTTLQLTPDGSGITTSLGGTRILFDGVPAPMIYTSATQVSAIVPYTLAAPGVAHLTVEYLGVPSTPVTVNTLPATPGIFTISQTGTGQGAVRNQDFSINGPANPSTSGQALIVYWTGGGQLNPFVPAGQLVSVNPPYPVVVFPMTATIGGVSAQILYSGAVPTLAPGILQTNILIPANAPRGNSVQLLLRVGDIYVTQSGVTVSIN